MLTQKSDWTESSAMIAEAEANKDIEDDHWERHRRQNYPLPTAGLRSALDRAC
jgi:hypothetical protein